MSDTGPILDAIRAADHFVAWARLHLSDPRPEQMAGVLADLRAALERLSG